MPTINTCKYDVAASVQTLLSYKPLLENQKYSSDFSDTLQTAKLYDRIINRWITDYANECDFSSMSKEQALLALDEMNTIIEKANQTIASNEHIWNPEKAIKPAVVYATKNQYNVAPNNMGMSACALISLCIAEAFSNNVNLSSGDIDAIMLKAVNIYEPSLKALKNDPKTAASYKDASHLIPDHLQMLTKHGIKEAPICKSEKVIELYNDRFESGLKKLLDTCDKGKAISGLLVKDGKTLTLCVRKLFSGNSEIQIFDSHGDNSVRNANKDTMAYVRTFTSTQAAANFLAETLPTAPEMLTGDVTFDDFFKLAEFTPFAFTPAPTIAAKSTGINNNNAPAVKTAHIAQIILPTAPKQVSEPVHAPVLAFSPVKNLLTDMDAIVNLCNQGEKVDHSELTKLIDKAHDSAEKAGLPSFRNLFRGQIYFVNRDLGDNGIDTQGLNDFGKDAFAFNLMSAYYPEIAKRTQTLFLLEMLVAAASKGSIDDLRELFPRLEKNSLDTFNSIKGKVYSLSFKRADYQDHPDFGGVAFLDNGRKASNEVRIQACQETLKELKTAWKM